MDIQVGRYYRDREGGIIKVLAHEQKQMLPMPDALTGRPDTDPAHTARVDCFLCRDDEGVDFYVLTTGQVCNVWIGKNGEAVYSVPDPAHSSDADLVSESTSENVDEQRYEKEFTTIWRLGKPLMLRLLVRAGDEHGAYKQLPSIHKVEEALRPLFSSPVIEMLGVFYDSEGGYIEEMQVEKGKDKV